MPPDIEGAIREIVPWAAIGLLLGAAIHLVIRSLYQRRDHEHSFLTLLVLEWDTSSTLHQATKVGYACACGTMSVMQAPPLR